LAQFSSYYSPNARGKKDDFFAIVFHPSDVRAHRCSNNKNEHDEKPDPGPYRPKPGFFAAIAYCFAQIVVWLIITDNIAAILDLCAVRLYSSVN
jgi:hypothetical protein